MFDPPPLFPVAFVFLVSSINEIPKQVEVRMALLFFVLFTLKSSTMVSPLPHLI